MVWEKIELQDDISCARSKFMLSVDYNSSIKNIWQIKKIKQLGNF